MDWANNPIANVPGPVFLGIYAILLAVVFTVSRRKLADAEAPEGKSPAPPVPDKIDPYEIAYLRGGVNEVVRLAVIHLIQRGALIRKPDKKIPTNSRVLQADASQVALAGKMTDLEDKVFHWFDPSQSIVSKWLGLKPAGKTPTEMFLGDALPKLIEPHCQEYHDRLLDQALLRSPEELWTAKQTFFAGFLFLLGVGAFKICMAVLQDHDNLGFLIAMMVLSPIVLAVICGRKRQTQRGLEYLEDLKVAHGFVQNGASQPRTSNDPSSILLAVGIFGVTALIGTEFDDFTSMFHAATASSGTGGCGSGCGGGCGGGGCGGGGCGG